MTSTQDGRNDFGFALSNESFEEIAEHYDIDDIARRRLEQFDNDCERRHRLQEDIISDSNSEDSEDLRTRIQLRLDALNNVHDNTRDASQPLFTDDSVTEVQSVTEPSTQASTKSQRGQSQVNNMATVDLKSDDPTEPQENKADDNEKCPQILRNIPSAMETSDGQVRNNITMKPQTVGLITTGDLDSSCEVTDTIGPCIIDELWTKFESVIARQGRKVKQIQGDGFCLLNSISQALWLDHGILFTEEHLKYITVAHIRHHGEKYSPFHFNSKEQVLADVQAFFQTRCYNQNVVDLMVSIAADALFVDIFIYQENEGRIQLLKMSPSVKAEKRIYLQFLHNGGSALGNHYNAVVINKNPSPCIDLTNSFSTDVNKVRDLKRPSRPSILDDFPALKRRISNYSERKGGTGSRGNCHTTFNKLLRDPSNTVIQEIEGYKEEVHSEKATNKDEVNAEVILIDDDENTSEKIYTSSTASKASFKSELQYEHYPPPAHSQVPQKLPDAFPMDLTMSNLDILASLASQSTDVKPELIDVSNVQEKALDLTMNKIANVPIDLTVVKQESKITSVHLKEEILNPPAVITISSSESDNSVQAYSNDRSSDVASLYTDSDVEVSPEHSSASNDIGLRKNDDFPISKFEDMMPTLVEKLPEDINGTKFYLIQAEQHEWHEAVTDRRHFVLNTCKVKSFKGVRRMGWCQGGWKCENTNCPFLKTSPGGEPNRGNWERGSTKLKKICYSCHTYAKQDFCGARKLVEFSPEHKQVMVYHVGEHNCTLKPPSGKRRKRINEALQGKYGKVGPAELQREEVRKRINEWDIEGAYEAATDFVDWRLVANEQERRVMEMFPDMNSFDAVAACKVKADKFDKYWIYRIIDSRHNITKEKTSDLIWKSSLPQIKLGLQMDRDSNDDNPLRTCPVYFDALHQRVIGFQSFALWILHPALKKVVRLACMELRTENTADVQKFFEIWNECLAEVSGDPNYKFNPVKFICDEAGSNFRAILNVYGEEVAKTRVNACYWHYTRNAELKSKELPLEVREDFIKICTEMATNPTVARYEECKATLIKLDEATKVLGSWIKWWDARRSHVFAAFTGCGHSESNLAEVANAGWKRRAPLRLVDACLDDVCTALAQEVNLRNFYQHSGFTVGKGPSQSQRARNERRKQMSRADMYLDIIGDEESMLRQAEQAENPHAFMPGGSSRHRPPKSGNSYGIQGEEFVQKRRRNRKQENLKPGPTLERQKFTALEVLGEPVENFTDPLSRRSVPNHKDPPVLALVGKLNVSRCQGCGGNITKKQIKEAQDMVFKRKGIRGYMKAGVFHQYEGTLYYHLRMECILRKEPNMENKDMTITDETFRQLNQTQLEHLCDIGYLAYILANKM